jgi:hypothetical protein
MTLMLERWNAAALHEAAKRDRSVYPTNARMFQTRLLMNPGEAFIQSYAECIAMLLNALKRKS